MGQPLTVTVLTVYQLQKDREVFYKKSVGEEEKSDHNVYLKNSHWTFLDSLADSHGISRNQALRNILDEVMKSE